MFCGRIKFAKYIITNMAYDIAYFESSCFQTAKNMYT